MANAKVLISGAGIAGPTLAYWLDQYGFKPMIIENSPVLRTGGYIIDFWGEGYEIAEKMGILPELSEKGYKVEEVRIVDGSGEKVGGFSSEVFKRIAGDKFLSLGRGDLASSVYNQIDGKVGIIFGDSIANIAQHPEGVEVEFNKGPDQTFDLVIGADGLHSKVRQLVFGPSSSYEKFLGYRVAAAEIQDYESRDENVYLIYSAVGKHVARFSMRDNRTLVLFVFRDENPVRSVDHDKELQLDLLHERFKDCGWECDKILSALGETENIYFDRVSQIHLPNLTSNRVALVGDAAHCLSLMAGQGSSLAMYGAYVLAEELKNHKGDHVHAFSAYEQRIAALITKKQKAANQFARAFAPKTKLGLKFRNWASAQLENPKVADFLIGRAFKEN